MARLSRTQNISVTDTVSANTLHQLIETATISGISGNDFSTTGGIFFPCVTNVSPNPTIAPFWYNPDHTDPVFRVYARPWNIWLTVGPDRFEVPLRNASGAPAPRGALVVASGASDFTLAANASINALGFLQGPTAAGAYGPVALCGIGFALYGSGNSGSTDPTAGTALIARGALPGYVAAMDIMNSEGSGPMFGQWLEGFSSASNASGHGALLRAHIWSPRLTTGF